MALYKPCIFIITIHPLVTAEVVVHNSYTIHVGYM